MLRNYVLGTVFCLCSWAGTSSTFSQGTLKLPDRLDSVDTALRYAEAINSARETIGNAMVPDFHDLAVFEDFMCGLSASSPEAAMHAAGSGSGTADRLQRVDAKLSQILALTAALPPDAGESHLREVFERHGCNWREVVPGPEAVPEFLTMSDLADSYGMLGSASPEDIDALTQAAASGTAIGNGRPNDDPEIALPQLDLSEDAFSSSDRSAKLANILGADPVPADIHSVSSSARLCEKYKNIGYSQQCVGVFEAEADVAEGRFTALDYCRIAAASADPTVAAAPAALVAVGVVLGAVLTAKEAVDLGYEVAKAVHGENEMVNDILRWDAQDTIADGQERLFEIEQEQVDLAGDNANPADYESVVASDMSDEDKEEWVHLQLEKREIEADMAEAQETLDDLPDAKPDNTPSGELSNCDSPEALVAAEAAFSEYRRQLEAMAAQCRGEMDETLIYPTREPVGNNAGTCDLEAVENDLNATLQNLANPETQERLSKAADQYQLDRQHAWNNLSCSRECGESGGTCTLDSQNRTVCVPTWDFYGMEDPMEMLRQAEANAQNGLPYEPFSISDSFGATAGACLEPASCAAANAKN